jgi:hypothetical protein
MGMKNRESRKIFHIEVRAMGIVSRSVHPRDLPGEATKGSLSVI